MTQPLHIPSLTPGSRVQDVFLLLEVDIRTQANGDPYTILTLGNSSGSIGTEPFWSERRDEIAGLRAGHVLQVIGEVITYRDRKQLKVASVRQVPKDSVDPAALLPSVGPVDRYWETLDGWRQEIGKPRLRKVVDLFYQEDAFRQRYEQCPGAIRGHHAAIGGLLKHTTEVAAIGRTVARACGADQELVLAGVLLHDIGKLETYRWDGLLEYSERGRLLGHIILGVQMLERRLNEEPEPPCTELERDILIHLMVSHHGRLEFGSPVTPMTLEAEVLHWADNASAKTASVADALRDDGSFPDGLVSLPQWTLDRRRVFRGTSDWGA
ncbi:MAG: HD domain-containing protein [Gemmatimonadales bacterium]|nr:HD domain-containing protein [Gemmatimonadales bacterium]NIN10095.1 HD domain-containing protein [Gemmatimonadales bacterium]NIR02579.1 HD domain-containing protein [Gemmatimonadales bacterium]NIS66273.1 HD domain-containing protein [Gemmatimonadales bacterium]